MKALRKILLALTAIAALLVAYPASLQAVPTTYQYTGHPFTDVSGPYTTSDFVTVMLTLAGPLGANMPLTQVTPAAFTLFDGVQTITNLTANGATSFFFATDASGSIIGWTVLASIIDGTGGHQIESFNTVGIAMFDEGSTTHPDGTGESGLNFDAPGTWARRVPDTGSTLSLMTLTLMALGLVARRFQRAAG